MDPLTLGDFMDLQSKVNPFSDLRLIGLVAGFYNHVGQENPGKLFAELPRSTELGTQSARFYCSIVYGIEKQAVASVCIETGRCVVEDGDKVFVIDVRNSTPTPAGNTHLGMWMQGPFVILSVAPGPYPYTELIAWLKEQNHDHVVRVLSES